MTQYKKIEVNDVFQSNMGGSFTVTKVINQEIISIVFNDEFQYETTVQSWNIRKGSVKNPYARRLFNVGYLGVGKFKSRLGPSSLGHLNTVEYNAWINMLSRCYNKNSTDRLNGYSSYDNVMVDEAWFNFQVFAEWYTKEVYRIHKIAPTLCLHLDKDLINPKAKTYSAVNCCLIPAEINSAIIVKNNVKNKKLPANLKKMSNGKYCFKFITMHTTFKMVDFETEQACVEAFIKAKEDYIKSLAIKYIEILPENVYFNLINYIHPNKEDLLSIYK